VVLVLSCRCGVIGESGCIYGHGVGLHTRMAYGISAKGIPGAKYCIDLGMELSLLHLHYQFIPYSHDRSLPPVRDEAYAVDWPAVLSGCFDSNVNDRPDSCAPSGQSIGNISGPERRE